VVLRRACPRARRARSARGSRPTRRSRIAPNVQFVEVVDRRTIRIEIWERGAGYTLASGSSSCAAAAVVHRLGLVDAAVTVQMRGGTLTVETSPDWQVRQSGPAAPVFRGEWPGG